MGQGLHASEKQGGAAPTDGKDNAPSCPPPQEFQIPKTQVVLKNKIIKIKYTDTVEHNILVKQEKNN